MSDVFIDSNVLVKILGKEKGYKETIKSLAGIKICRFNFKISCISHFEILWGFQLYGGDVGKYWNILEKFEFEVIPLIREDSELASKHCNSRSRIRDFFIGATVKNRGGILLTYNVSDFKWTEKAYTPEEFLSEYQKL